MKKIEYLISILISLVLPVIDFMVFRKAERRTASGVKHLWRGAYLRNNENENK